jgi:DNA-binding SARP family transcriptional activator
MATMVVELLGRPRIVRDGREVRLRGRKGWALLAYLVLADRAPSRGRLAELLYPDADDPLGALRWSLSQLRNGLGPDTTLAGDPVLTALPVSAVLDVDIVRQGHWTDAVELPGLGRDLLEGVTPAASASYELWLANERRRLAGAAGDVLHEAALACLATGESAAALAHASRLAELHPLDEANHVLLVQCLTAVGDHGSAREHVRRSSLLLRRELGVEPSPALRATDDPVPGTGRASLHAVPAMLEVAEGAVAAGAVTEGLRTLSDATEAARRGRDRRLLARALLLRGRALVHVGRGSDEEGGALLHEAARLAAAVGDAPLAAAAHRELAFTDLQRGRYERALRSVATATPLAADDDAELARLEAIEGACLSDQGRHGPAMAVLASAADRADRAGDTEAAVFACSFLGRSHLLRGDLTAARAALEGAARGAREVWRAFSPWPESLLAETDLQRGDLETAQARLERALVLGRQLDDPCLESVAMRGLGLVAVARGRSGHGLRLLGDAPRVSRRLPDSYVWIEAYALDALCTVAIEREVAAAPRWVTELETLASRCGMRELVVRALLHRAHLGHAGAASIARELVATVDNPVLGTGLADTG